METKEKVLATMKEAGEPLNAGKIAELSGLDRKEVDKAMKQLRTGTGNLVSRAQRLSALNIKVSKSLPQSMLEESDDLPVEE